MTKLVDEILQNELNVHVVYASDNGFANILGVSLMSLYENSDDVDNIFVYILDSGISAENKEKINSISTEYGQKEISWIRARDITKELGVGVSLDRGSVSQYSRLFVGRDLPINLNKVIYLDCDTIVHKSISNLWNYNLHGNTIGALSDAFSKYYRFNIGLECNDIMFNSGVMIIDLQQWRERETETRLLEFISSRHGKIQQGDQGALNAVLAQEVYSLPPEFNAVTIFFDFSYDEINKYRRPPFFYAESEITKAINDPIIIHYTTSFVSVRPWFCGCEHKFASVWLDYKNKSPWKTIPIIEYKRKGIKSLYVKLVLKLPRPVMIFVSGILQVYGRPLMWKLINWRGAKDDNYKNTI